MALYQYEGRNRKGQPSKGRVKADNEREARLQLRESGIAVMSIHEKQGVLYQDVAITKKKIKLRDFVIYLRQFATLLEAGISVVDATVIVAEQTSSKVLKATLSEIEDELRSGNPFSSAAEKQRKVFPPLFINMMRAGEIGGNMAEILERLAIYYEKQHKTRQKVISALSYPLVVGLIAVVVVIFLLSFVVPTFADMFASFDAELPMITTIVLNAGNVFARFWWTLIPVVVGGVVGYRMIRQRPRWNYYLDLVFLKIPIFGSLLQKAALARMTRTLSSLFSSSVPILEAVSIVERVVGNEVIAEVMRQTRQSVERGESIAAPMETHWAFPPLITQMIIVGEKTGSLDTMLDKVADFYEDEVEASTDQIKSLIEPLMIVILAGVVGTIVAAIALPMFDIFNQVGN